MPAQTLTNLIELATIMVRVEGGARASTGGDVYVTSPPVAVLTIGVALVLYVIADWLVETLVETLAGTATHADMPGDLRSPEQCRDDARALLAVASTKRSRIFTCTG